MKKLITLFLALAGFVGTVGAATETTVYYAVQPGVIADKNVNSVKLNVNVRGENYTDVWRQLEMTNTGKTYMGFAIYSCTYTDNYDGVQDLQFQLYEGSTQQWTSTIYESTWHSVSDYNGKMYVHGAAQDGMVAYAYDTSTKCITYHIKAINDWTPTKAYEFKGYVNTYWPGNDISANSLNSGWYDYTVLYSFDKIIFNSGNGGTQTVDISIDDSKSEYWITPGNKDSENHLTVATSTDAPNNWKYTRSVTSGNFGTICLPFAATIEGAKVYKIASKVVKNDQLTAINLDEVTGTLVAGHAYIFKATGPTLTATYSGTYADATEADGMMGNLSASDYTVPSGNYVVYNNIVCPVGDNVTVGRYRAYITLDGIDEATSRGTNFISFEEATGIENIQAENGQNVIYNLQGQRVTDAQKGLVIVNGKKMLRK